MVSKPGAGGPCTCGDEGSVLACVIGPRSTGAGGGDGAADCAGKADVDGERGACGAATAAACPNTGSATGDGVGLRRGFAAASWVALRAAAFASLARRCSSRRDRQSLRVVVCGVAAIVDATCTGAEAAPGAAGVGVMAAIVVPIVAGKCPKCTAAAF